MKIVQNARTELGEIIMVNDTYDMANNNYCTTYNMFLVCDVPV